MSAVFGSHPFLQGVIKWTDVGLLARSPCRPWDAGLREAAETAGAEVLADLAPSHAIRFDSADDAWQVMTHAGPLHSRLLRYGEEHMEGLRRVFLSSVEAERRPFDVRPNARILLLRRMRLAASM